MNSLLIIVVMIAGGGIIAYLGNIVGRRIGRSRLTISKLRPRYTANIITVVTGALIAFSTFAFLLLILSDFRTAFFDWEKLVKAREELTRELDANNSQLLELKDKIGALEERARSEAAKITSLSDEKTALENDIAQLKEIATTLLLDVKSVRSGQLVYKVGEPIIVATVEGGKNYQESVETIKNLLSQADASVRLKALEAGAEVDTTKPLIWLTTQGLEAGTEYLSTRQEEIVIKLSAAHNAVAGEVVVVALELVPNRLIYRSGQVLGEADLSTGLLAKEVESKIFNLLYQIGQEARKKGVMADSSGLVGSLHYNRIYQVMERYRRGRFARTLKVIAAKDVYTAGPLEVDFILEPK